MLIFGKGKYFSVFGCISKNFPENIFWCLEKKENTNSEKHKPHPRKKHQRLRRRSRSQIAITYRRWCFFMSCGLCFSGFVFSFFFSKYQKIFSGKFFEIQPNTEKYFPFPEISISGKYVFSGKRFTATKHSLSPRTKRLGEINTTTSF